MREIILTGSDGFIGKSFKKTLSKTWDVVEVEKHNCWSFLLTFKDWSQVDFISVSYTHLTLPTSVPV